MTNNDLVQMIEEYSPDSNAIILEGDEFADGAVGLTINDEVVYDYDKLVASLSKAWNCSEEDAVEWIEFNTIRGLPYMKQHGNPPIIMISFE